MADIKSFRRSGSAGSGPETTQKADDMMASDAKPIFPSDVSYSEKAVQRMHKLADDSHQEHKARTGQVPEHNPADDGYTDYSHQPKPKGNEGE